MSSHLSQDSTPVRQGTDNSRGHESSPEQGEVESPGVEKVEKRASDSYQGGSADAPPLPKEAVPPLPTEAPPIEDDGWDPIWDANAQAFYFYNYFTQASQWTNPRLPEALQPAVPGVGNHDRILERAPGTEEPPLPQQQRPHGGYDPAIHGDYDPTAPYAQEVNSAEDPSIQSGDPAAVYAATGAFNRFTGKWQDSSISPDTHNDENKSKRQMSAFFDVDAAANSHNGKSLKAERSGKKLSKQELKAFKEKRKERKEEKRRAWLRD